MCHNDDDVSHAIEAVTSYRIDGQTFPTPKKAIAFRRDRIGSEIVDKMTNSGDFSPSARIKIHDWLCDNRELVRKLLDY